MGKERKYGPNGIEWNEDRKCKVKVKEKGNHNNSCLMALGVAARATQHPASTTLTCPPNGLPSLSLSYYVYLSFAINKLSVLRDFTSIEPQVVMGTGNPGVSQA